MKLVKLSYNNLMNILISSSKTMNHPVNHKISDYLAESSQPVFYQESQLLMSQLQSYSINDLKQIMKTSDQLTDRIYYQIQHFNQVDQFPAIFYFSGDVYKGLNSIKWQKSDYLYANSHLKIISGLYGILKPLDLIQAYRLEMGYKIKLAHNQNLYDFWQDKIALSLQNESLLINLLPQEYFRVIKNYCQPSQLIIPHFLTKYPGNNFKFVAIHAKFGRGLLASWLIKNKTDQIVDFNFKNFRFNSELTNNILEPIIVFEPN